MPPVVNLPPTLNRSLGFPNPKKLSEMAPQTFLCCGQCSFWQAALQYFPILHFEHTLKLAPKLSQPVHL